MDDISTQYQDLMKSGQEYQNSIKITQTYGDFNELALKYGINLTKFLNHDLYVVFQGIYKEQKVIVKFFTEDESDDNNEFEVLQYLEDKIDWTPRALLKVHTSNDNDYIYKMIVYTYIEGEDLPSDFDKEKCYKEISSQLEILHSFGLVHGDVNKGNILKTEDGYTLIDYGRTFSVSHSPFPPMGYMLDDDDIPTQENDIEDLKWVCDIDI